MKQDIRIAQSKQVYASRDAVIEALNTSVVHHKAMLLQHNYTDESGKTVAMLTLGIGDGQGEDKYQIVVNELDLEILATYTNTTPTWIELGGIEVGSTFDKNTISEMFDKLLYPYVAPSISLKSSVSKTIYEHGETISNILFTATTKKYARNITEVRFLCNSSVVNTISSPKEAGGTETYTHPSITSTSTFQAQVYDGTTRVSSNGITYTFVYPAYIGKIAKTISVPTQDDIKKLGKKIQSPGTLTATYTYNDEKICVATPPGWTISSIKDPSGYEMIDSFRMDNVQVTGLDGNAITYNVYTLKESIGLENFKLTFNR